LRTCFTLGLPGCPDREYSSAASSQLLLYRRVRLICAERRSDIAFHSRVKHLPPGFFFFFRPLRELKRVSSPPLYPLSDRAVCLSAFCYGLKSWRTILSFSSPPPPSPPDLTDSLITPLRPCPGKMSPRVFWPFSVDYLRPPALPHPLTAHH